MFCAQSQSAFAHHFDLCKSRIKHEMYLKVDKMVDRVYDQALTDLQQFGPVDQSRLTRQRVDTIPSKSPFSCLNQSANFISPKVNDFANIPPYRNQQTFVSSMSQSTFPIENQSSEPKLVTCQPTQHKQLYPTHSITPNSLPTRQFSLTSPVPTPPGSITNAQITLPSEFTNFESCELPIEHTVEISNEPSATVQATQNPPLFMSLSKVTDQANDNLNDEEICECDECVNGIEIDKQVEDDDEEEDDGDYEDIPLIDDDQEDEESSRQVKKPRLGTFQPNSEQSSVSRQSVIHSITEQSFQSVQQTHQSQSTEVNNRTPKESSSQSFNSQPTSQPNSSTHNKQLITLSRHCPNCPRTFTEDKLLSQHMLDEHSIGPIRCVVKDCAQSFCNKFILCDHIKHVHQHITQWHCDKCPKHFPKYKTLSNHKLLYHQLGQFQCAFPQCTFTAECKVKVYSHYKQKHKHTQFECEHCDYQTYDSISLKRHQLTYSSIKAYRCKWPECHFAAAILRNTIGHIERKHFARNPSSSPNLGHPKEYVEVLNDLL